MSVFRFINKYMIKLLMLAVVLGLITGYFIPGLGQRLQVLYPFSLFVMLYPMMIGIKLGEVTGAAKRLGFMTVVMLFNYLASPLLDVWLAKTFLSAHPDFAVGLILTGVVPCG